MPRILYSIYLFIFPFRPDYIIFITRTRYCFYYQNQVLGKIISKTNISGSLLLGKIKPSSFACVWFQVPWTSSDSPALLLCCSFLHSFCPRNTRIIWIHPFPLSRLLLDFSLPNNSSSPFQVSWGISQSSLPQTLSQAWCSPLGVCFRSTYTTCWNYLLLERPSHRPVSSLKAGTALIILISSK